MRCREEEGRHEIQKINTDVPRQSENKIADKFESSPTQTHHQRAERECGNTEKPSETQREQPQKTEPNHEESGDHFIDADRNVVFAISLTHSAPSLVGHDAVVASGQVCQRLNQRVNPQEQDR